MIRNMNLLKSVGLVLFVFSLVVQEDTLRDLSRIPWRGDWSWGW